MKKKEPKKTRIVRLHQGTHERVVQDKKKYNRKKKHKNEEKDILGG